MGKHHTAALFRVCGLGPGSLYVGFPQSVQVPDNWLLGILVIVIVVQVSGKYVIIKYLDPEDLIVVPNGPCSSVVYMRLEVFT